ncbi:MAG: hypothetical protein WCJ09_09305 [Planctomycetota bacterium]
MSQVAEGLLHDVQFGIESRFIAGTEVAVFEAAKLWLRSGLRLWLGRVGFAAGNLQVNLSATYSVTRDTGIIRLRVVDTFPWLVTNIADGH